MKQIRMSASDFVKEDLNVGIRRVLQELRTLARLEHRNIVRYYNSWTEYNQGLAVSPPEPAENPVEHLSTIAEEPSFSNGSKPTDASGPNIVFENSESESADSETSESVSMDTESLDDGGVVVFEEPSESGFNIVFENSESADRETSNSVSEDTESSDNEDVNVVFEESSDEIASTKEAKNAASRDTGLSEDSEYEAENASSIFADGSSTPGRALTKRRANINEPTVTIYFTMSLHPLSLTKYITARRSDTTKDGHCFCPLPSLHIFHDILDGVEYLHSEGIVHRDLKPGNVFLNVGERMECCDRPGYAVVPKIGDFGLVAVIDTEHAPLPASSRNEHLGTTFYSAPEGGRNPAVDVWALGIILFELLYMFDTVSERAIVLRQLTNGASDALPIDKKFAEIVKGCCRKEARERLTVPELKQAVAKAIDELEAKVNPGV
jgi:translation initiation factor 2-alpha kinase 3